jgi:hypothetical protein
MGQDTEGRKRQGMKVLRYLNIWLMLGWAQVCLIILLSLIPSPVELPGLIGMDKLIHLFAYAFVMLWFGLCYTPCGAYNRLGIGLVLMGILLELIQGITGYRSMSYLDMTANFLGVASGWLLAKTRFSAALVYIEDKLIPAG